MREPTPGDAEHDLVVLGEAEHRLPVLPATAIVLYRAPGARSPAADRLGDH